MVWANWSRTLGSCCQVNHIELELVTNVEAVFLLKEQNGKVLNSPIKYKFRGYLLESVFLIFLKEE